jgi:hypothetical protein
MGGISATLWILIAAAGVALALVAVGWRGYRVGDHPYCRGCGFDLFGRAVGSTACPECGRDLSRAESMVIGIHCRRRGLMTGGLLILVPALSSAGIVVWGQANHVDWQKQKPSWWLVREAESSVANRRDAALNELTVRLKAKQLSKGMIARLVQRGLQYQADVARPWAPPWGDVIETARANGQVSEADWKTYGEQAMADYASVVLRPQLTRRNGVPLQPHRARTEQVARWLMGQCSGAPFELRIKGARLGSVAQWWVAQRVDLIEIDGGEAHNLGGISSLGPVPNAAPSPGVVSSSSSSIHATPDDLLKDLSFGRHTGHVRMNITLIEFGQLRKATDRMRASRSRDGFDALLDGTDGTALATVRQQLPFTVEVVPEE